jgi:hypothetical protein
VKFKIEVAFIQDIGLISVCENPVLRFGKRDGQEYYKEGVEIPHH